MTVEKTCPKCRLEPRRRLRSGRLLTYCKKCDAAYQRENYRKRMERAREEHAEPQQRD